MSEPQHRERRFTSGRFEYRLEVYGDARLFDRGSADDDAGSPTASVLLYPAREDRSMRLALASIGPDPRRSSGEDRPLSTTDLYEALEQPDDSMQHNVAAAGASAYGHKTQLQIGVIEVSAGSEGDSDDDGEDEMLTRIMPKRFHAALEQERERQGRLTHIQICTGGLPPLIHIYDGGDGMVFPVRSWVPAGLFPDWQPLCQNIDCEAGDRLILHTEYPVDRPHGLREFHDSLRAGKPKWDDFTPGSGMHCIVLHVDGLAEDRG